MNGSALRGDHLSVCVCTYRRNQLLERLLRGLAFQRTDELFTYSIVVVDNDEAGSARETVATCQAGTAVEIRYSVEPEHGIPAARNHALKLASGNYIGIIDDDELPCPDWLLRMYEAIRTFGADGALGPVFPFFDETPPAWLIKSGICELPVHRTGTLLHWSQTRTGNVLVKREVFDTYGLSFDPRFRTGGSDQEFFRQAMMRGCRFVAVEEAPVYEVVPAVRWTRAYWIKRALVNGFNAEKYSSENMSRARRARLTLKSAVGSLVYGLGVPLSACLGQHRLIVCLEKGCYHFSRTCAACGIELWTRRDF